MHNTEHRRFALVRRSFCEDELTLYCGLAWTARFIVLITAWVECYRWKGLGKRKTRG